LSVTSVRCPAVLLNHTQSHAPVSSLRHLRDRAVVRVLHRELQQDLVRGPLRVPAQEQVRVLTQDGLPQPEAATRVRRKPHRDRRGVCGERTHGVGGQLPRAELEPREVGEPFDGAQGLAYREGVRRPVLQDVAPG